MDTSAEQSWARSGEQIDPMSHMNTDLDDLGNLFEFGDIDLNNIPSVDTINNYDQHLQQNGTHPTTPFDEINEVQAMSGTSAQDFGAQDHFNISQNADMGQQQQQYGAQAQTGNPYASNPMYQPALQQNFHPGQQFQFPGMQGFPSNQHVPPTPNSFEMHGEAGRFMQQPMDPQQRAILEQRYQLSKDDASAFTPMLSPAGTPQYNVQPEFTIPGAYFSPLTSPMLHAQNQQRAHYHQGYYTNPSTAPSSNATSPLDPNADVDMLGDEISLSEPAQARKSSRRKTVTPRSAGPLARVKQSPIQKAAKRKSTTMLSSLVPPREMDSILDSQRSGSVQPSSGSLHPRQNETSENGSISPEPLSEALMGPPPRPSSSTTNSPALTAQKQMKTTTTTGPAATPKSLFSRRGGPQSAPSAKSSQNPSIEQDEHMEFAELELPAAAADEPGRRANLAQLTTHMSTVSPAEHDTPRLPSRKTPKLGSAGTPLSALPASPSVAGSPLTASTPGALLKGGKVDSKAGRNGRKRSSVSGTGSTLVSPSLRPRISPSIKPLLPEGAALHSPTHALLLASKSNYQNLLEGNHLPGVNYPDSLSTGLTSKRTSHKVAEQGRRNRINEALKEMQSLLPKPAVVKGAKENSNSDASPEANPESESKESKESKEDAQLKSNSSKAATVESANEYIRKLQSENAALLQLKAEHEEMKRKLEEHASSASSTEREMSAAETAAA